jgi:hypothetical protein
MTRGRSLDAVTETWVSDEELAAEALAADPDAPLPADAKPFTPEGDGLLPDWYMPSPMPGAHRASGVRRRVTYVVISAVLLINAAGLCVTYGHVGVG